jgi:hypothetical protein
LTWINFGRSGRTGDFLDLSQIASPAQGGKIGVVNVRWDSATIDTEFWSKLAGAAREPAAPATGACVAVRVMLFGALSDMRDASPISLEVHSPFSVRDVIEELGRRFLPALRERVLDPAGRKYRHCRVFIDGLPAEDIDAPVVAQTTQPQVEMILLTAAEGG